MKKYLFFIVSFFLFCFLLAVVFWWRGSSKAVSLDSNSYRFVIPKGYSAMQVANKLKEKNLIKSTLAFKVYIQFSGKADKILAGEYTLSPNYSLAKVVEKLVGGPDQVWVTIPEGLRREEITSRFIEALELGDSDSQFRQNFLSLSEKKEGFLFPDTYLVPKDFEASKAVSLLFSTFEARTKDLNKDIGKNGLTLLETITLASLIEREAISEEERPMIAGILLRRLTAGWPLQVDAAVQYAMASKKCSLGDAKCNWWEPLTKEDIAVNSLYNTYKYKGLPPTPICNPGLSSIQAAIFPKESEFWFYLHDTKGQIHYAETVEEHNQNIRVYLGK